MEMSENYKLKYKKETSVLDKNLNKDFQKYFSLSFSNDP